jgi:hypothetical protein
MVVVAVGMIIMAHHLQDMVVKTMMDLVIMVLVLTVLLVEAVIMDPLKVLVGIEEEEVVAEVEVEEPVAVVQKAECAVTRAPLVCPFW